MKQTDERRQTSKIKTAVPQFIGSSLTVNNCLFSVDKL